jgi:hypothetical protein
MRIIMHRYTRSPDVIHAHQYRNRRRPHERGPKGLWIRDQKTNCGGGTPIDDQTAPATSLAWQPSAQPHRPRGQVIVVDSSVWIDFLNGRNVPHVRRLRAILGIERHGSPADPHRLRSRVPVVAGFELAIGALSSSKMRDRSPSLPSASNAASPSRR